MAKKSVRSNPNEPRRDRVLLFLETAFGGNQNRAARALGVSQSLISRVVSGERPASDQLLGLIADHPGINRSWIDSGVGPIFEPETIGTLPVVDAILPGPPSSHADLLRGDRHPVSGPMERESRYWLRLSDLHPIVKVTAFRFAAGDLLLIETARDHLDRLDLLHGRICAAVRTHESKTTCLLASVTVWGGILSFQYHGGDELTHAPIAKKLNPLLRRNTRKISKRRPRKGSADRRETLDAYSDAATDTSPISEAKANQASEELASATSPSEQVVGLVLALDRPSVFG